MHSQHVMIAHFLAYKKKRILKRHCYFWFPQMQILMPPSSHFNGDTYILDVWNESMIKSKQNSNLKCKDCLKRYFISFLCTLVFLAKNLQQGWILKNHNCLLAKNIYRIGKIFVCIEGLVFVQNSDLSMHFWDCWVNCVNLLKKLLHLCLSCRLLNGGWLLDSF